MTDSSLGGPKRLRSLGELADLRRQLTARAAHAKRRTLATPRAQPQDEHALFQAAMSGVQALAPSARADLRAPPPRAWPRQRLADERAALWQAWSGAVDGHTLLQTDALLSFGRPGVGSEVLVQLRQGRWAVQRQLDLHGLRSDEARLALAQFVRQAYQHGLRCLRIVTGKGLGSPGRAPVLKHKAWRWLAQRQEVLAFVQAQPAQGGAGALLVLLQAQRAKLCAPSPTRTPSP